jgi:hypothetical protein
LKIGDGSNKTRGKRSRAKKAPERPSAAMKPPQPAIEKKSLRDQIVSLDSSFLDDFLLAGAIGFSFALVLVSAIKISSNSNLYDHESS